MKKRQAGFELLRIVAMLMIITLHYLDKGGILPGLTSQPHTAGFLAWGLEALCVSAVNVYVLISAWFLAESDYRPGKAVKLWAEVFFYSVGIAAILVMTGVIAPGELDIYRVMNYVFPVVEEHYWFVTAYLLMYLFAPLMNDTLRKLPRKTYRQGLVLLILLLSVSSSILPVRLPIDRLGYDALWFLCLYLVGAYLRYYGFGEKHSGKKGTCALALAGYFVSSALIYASLLCVYVFYLRTGSLGEFINRQYQYNSILCLSASVFLFWAFRNSKIPEGRAANIICRVASASFGVYLIHEHMEIRYLWPIWLGAGKYAETPWFLLHWAVSILLVYGVCMAIDFVRQAAVGWIRGRKDSARGA